MRAYLMYLILVIIQVFMISCDDFLEAKPEDQVADIDFWKSETNVSKFLTDTYAVTFLTQTDPENIIMLEACSDNAYNMWTGFFTDVKLVANGTQDAYSSVPSTIWKWRYGSIRRCFQIFENIRNVPDISEDFIFKTEAETRFLLAYNYYILTSLFGDVPLVSKVLTIEESKTIARAPKEIVIEYALGELEKASSFLDGKTTERGRANWGACQVLKARIYLMNNKYEDALNVINTLMGKYDLHKDGDTPYEDLFAGRAENSKEIIFSIIRDKTTGSISTGHIANQGFLLKAISGGDAFCAIMPTGSLVDSYPMSDGRLIHEKGSSYSPNDPYKDRDPRFYQSIIYPTGKICSLNTSTNTVDWIAYDPEDATTVPDHQYNAAYPSSTGYVWKKYVDVTPYGMTQITDCTNDLILMRYADVLLMKAECLAEIKGIESKAEIIDLIDMLRDRCHGGKVHRDNYNSKEDLINLVRNERRVELANEGLRYFDLLRWKIAENVPLKDGFGLSGVVYGAYMRLDGVGNTDRTVEVDGVPRRYVETRYFDPQKHYLQPIPQKEIDLNPNLKQNPNW